MKLKAITGIALTLFLIGLESTFNVQPVKASGTIYIRADGSVDPPTAPISSANNFTYIFTDNISVGIVVKRDNIVVDGAGYTVQGTGSGMGITLYRRSNVTIKSVQIKAFDHGITLLGSSSNIIAGNNITNNDGDAIWLSGSSNNTIIRNNITNNLLGVWLLSSSSNIISGNSITNNGDGIRLDTWSDANSICENNITANSDFGIVLITSSNNTIIGNNITDNGEAVYLWPGRPDPSLWPECPVSSRGSFDNKFHHNNFIDNTRQIYIEQPPWDGNIWDNDYPSGGNYWSDYTGADANGDGIGDRPHVIDSNNTDRYPLMTPYETPDTTPPTISILSPESKTYRVNDVPVTFAVSELASWIGYSLDSQMNVTIAGNATLSGLSDGSHGLIVYANDAAGNTGASEIIYFTIETQQANPFPWISAIVIAAVVGAALLVYLTKVKKTTEKVR